MLPKREIMQFPKLPLLESFCSTYSIHSPDLNRTVLVCVQHLLETTGSLLEQLLSLGLPSGQIYVLGKIYSNNWDVQRGLIDRGINVIKSSLVAKPGFYDEVLKDDVARMWHAVVERTDFWRDKDRLVVLDDGGFAIAGIPQSATKKLKVIGIEQTMSGLATGRAGNSDVVPVIEVASSAAKKYVEPPMICEATLSRLAIPIFERNREAIFGVVGLGNIGQAIVLGLLRRKAKVLGFDKDISQLSTLRGIKECSSIQEVFEESDIIFGCTGTDILDNSNWWKSLRGRKLLVSCSSQDREFASILASIKQTDPRLALDDVDIRLYSGDLKVVRGGFPANFDGSSESVPSKDIQMTRGLLLAAIEQAVLPLDRECVGEMLDPELQRYVVSRWFELEPNRASSYGAQLLNKFLDLDWIERHSGGKIRKPVSIAASAEVSASPL